MSNDVENRVVQLEMRNSSLEKGANQSIKTLDKLDKALDLKNGKRSFEDVEKAAEKCNFEPLLKAADAVSNRFSMMGIIGVRALERITDKAVDAGLALTKSLTVDQIAAGYSKYEQKTASVQTLINSTGKSIEEVNGYLSRLMWFSDETSYGFSDMTQALATMTSSGGDIDKLIPMIEGVANAVAFAGKGASEFQRVMYNLNQSYSGGYLTYMDWKSVQLAGAASKQLQQIFIDTAVSLGKIKEGEVTLDNFATTLQKKWADRDVMEKAFGYFDEMTQKAYEMIGTLDDNGEVIETASRAYEILAEQYDGVSIRAAKAAQEAKTFGEAIDATKDAVSSGWMRIFESIFGNYEQQKELWTGLSESLYDIFAAPLDTIGSLIDEAFQETPVTKLTDKLTKAGIGFNDFKAKIIEAAGACDIEIGDSADKVKTFGELLSLDWVNTDLVTNALDSFGSAEAGLDNLATAIDEINARDLASKLDAGEFGRDIAEMTKNLKEAGYDIESAQEVYDEAARDANATISFTSKSAKDASDAFKEAYEVAAGLSNEYYIKESGWKIGWDAVRNVLGTIIDRINAVKKAWNDIFPATTATAIKDAIVSFHQWSETLKMGEEEATSIYDRFSKVFTIVSKMGTVGKEAAGVVSSIINLLARFGDYILKLEPVQSFLQTMKDSLGKRIDAGESWLGTAADSLKNFAETIDSLDADDFAKFVDKITSPFETLASFFEPVLTYLKGLGGRLKDSFVALFSSMTGQDNGAVGLQAILGAGGIAGIFALIKKIKTATERGGITTIGKNISETLSSVKDAIESFTDNMNSSGLRNIAISIGLLSGALLLLASIDTERLMSGLLAFAAVVGIMYVAVNKLTKLNIGKNTYESGIGGFVKSLVGNLSETTQFTMMARSVEKIAIALLILSASVKILSTIDVGGAIVAVATLFAVTKIMEKFMTAMSKMEGGNISGLISIAVGMVLFASAIRILGAMDILSCVQGVLALGIVLGELKYFINSLREVNPGSVLATSISITIMSAALIVMSGAIAILGAIPFENAVQGIGIIAVLLVAFTLFAKKISSMKVDSLGSAAVFILAISAAMIPLAAALVIISLISDKIGSVVSLIMVIVAIAAAMALLGKFGGGAANLIATSVAILVVSAAIMLLTTALLAISAISHPIMTAVIMIGSLVVLLAVLGAAAFVLTPIMPMLLALSAVLILVGVGCLAAGAGMTLLSTGLIAFATAIIANIGTVIAAFVMLVSGVGAVLLALGGVVVSVLVQLIPSLAEAGLQMILALLTSFGAHVDEIGASALAIIVKIITVLAANVGALVQAAIGLALALVNGLANGIRDNSEKIMAAVRNILSSIIELVLTVFGDLLGMIPGIGPKIKDALSGAKDAVREFLAPESIGTSDDLSGTLVDSVASAGESASEEAAAQGENVGKSFTESLKEAISNGGSEGFDLSGYDIDSSSLTGLDLSSLGANGGADFMNSLAGGITDNSGTVSQAGAEVGDSLTQSVNESIENSSEETSNSIYSMLSNAVSTVDMDSIANVLSGNFMNSLGESFLSQSGASDETLSGNLLPLVQSMVDNTDLSGTGESMATTIATSFCTSLSSNTNKVEVSKSAESLGNEANSGAQKVDTTASGSYWGEGFNNGMWSWADRIWQTAYDIGRKAVEGVKAGTREGSPCKTTIQSGKFFDEGLIVGINLLAARVQMTAYKMGMRTAQAVEDGIQNGNPDGIVPVLDMSDVYNTLEEFDGTYRPVIKPMLDMSDVDPAYMNMRAFVSHGSSPDSTTESADPAAATPMSFSYVQNNYSPKALSRAEIYRQTKNQFSTVKGLFKK